MNDVYMYVRDSYAYDLSTMMFRIIGLARDNELVQDSLLDGDAEAACFQIGLLYCAAASKGVMYDGLLS